MDCMQGAEAAEGSPKEVLHHALGTQRGCLRVLLGRKGACAGMDVTKVGEKSRVKRRH